MYRGTAACPAAHRRARSQPCPARKQPCAVLDSNLRYTRNVLTSSSLCPRPPAASFQSTLPSLACCISATCTCTRVKTADLLTRAACWAGGVHSMQRLTWSRYSSCFRTRHGGRQWPSRSPRKVEASQAAPCQARPPGACRPQPPAAASLLFRRLQHDKLAYKHDRQLKRRHLLACAL